jgi:hypothetical protein
MIAPAMVQIDAVQRSRSPGSTPSQPADSFVGIQIGGTIERPGALTQKAALSRSSRSALALLWGQIGGSFLKLPRAER